RVDGDRYEVEADDDFPLLRLMLSSVESKFVMDGGSAKDVYLRVEADRGYASTSKLWSPGQFSIVLAPGHETALVASTEPWRAVAALQPAEAQAFDTER